MTRGSSETSWAKHTFTVCSAMLVLLLVIICPTVHFKTDSSVQLLQSNWLHSADPKHAESPVFNISHIQSWTHQRELHHQQLESSTEYVWSIALVFFLNADSSYPWLFRVLPSTTRSETHHLSSYVERLALTRDLFWCVIWSFAHNFYFWKFVTEAPFCLSISTWFAVHQNI